MKRSLLFPALILISLSPACGQATAPPADAETPAEVEVSTADTTGPQVGDKIGESAAEKAAQESSVAAAAAEAMREQEEMKARGVTEIGWEDLMPEGEEERLQKMYAAQMATLRKTPFVPCADAGGPYAGTSWRRWIFLSVHVGPFGGHRPAVDRLPHISFGRTASSGK